MMNSGKEVRKYAILFRIFIKSVGYLKENVKVMGKFIYVGQFDAKVILNFPSTSGNKNSSLGDSNEK